MSDIWFWFTLAELSLAMIGAFTIATVYATSTMTAQEWDEVERCKTSYSDS